MPEEEGAVLPPFLTVHQRRGTEGAEYVLTLTHQGQTRTVSVYDGDDSYWDLANLIDDLFPTEGV